MKKIFSLVLMFVIGLVFINPSGGVFADEIQSRNLFDPSLVTYDGPSGWSYGIIPVLPNTQYTFSVDNTLGNGKYYIFEYENTSWTSAVGGLQYDEDSLDYYDSNLNVNYITFTTTSTTNILSIDSDSLTGLTSEFVGVQLELSSSPTAWVAFGDVIADTESPVFSNNEAAIISNIDNPLEMSEILSGITVTDNSNETIDIIVESDNYSSNDNVLGDHIILLSATDSSGNTADATVTVKVVDISAPSVSIALDDIIYLESGEQETSDFELGIPTAIVSDNYDNDLVAEMTTDFNYQEIGSYTFTWTATDSSGNIGSKNITVIVEDTTAPVITLNGDNPLRIEFGQNYTELGSTCFDVKSCTAIATGSVNVGVLGSYEISYSATDASGNTGTATRTVIVEDTTAPVINVESQITYSVGSSLTVQDILDNATAIDQYDGDISDNITITLDEYTGNENTAGSYRLNIEVVDSSGNMSYELIDILVVDNEPPVFTFNELFMTPEQANDMSLQDLYDYFGIE